ncbi:MAG: peptidoglycan DD-metalloendopeptidase family protein [Chloroflexota bacterium]|nr:MAG: peptidoglycan DD-metalloendopeptidase family protein [Chloroflexota bacterium]
MDGIREFLQRYGAHLALVVGAIVLFIAASVVPFDDLLGFQVMADQRGESDDDAYGVLPENLLAADSAHVPADSLADLSNVPVLINNSLSPALNPYTFEGKKPQQQVITYTVQPNDTPIGIAEQFGIKPETLLGGNAFLSEEASALQAGSMLVILPVDGVLHDVGEGDSLERVAQLYGVTEEDIIAYEPNALEFPYRLYPGTQIMVPGGVRDVWFWTAPQLPSRPSSSDSTGSGIAPQIQGTGTFIWPVGYRRITQHYWYGHPAIDIGLPEGTAVLASDTGTVTWAGWNVYGYGNLIVINHGNGYETYYGHLSGINVVPGQVVYQGSQIGSSGNTGRSSGPHLHLEIRYFNSMLEPISNLR